MKARFHLPDFTENFNVNYLMVDMMEKLPQYFYDNIEIASVYGVFPPAIWNGGRFRRGRCSEDFIKQVINAFNSKGIPLRFSFTNVLLEEEHLKDEFCNKLMKMTDNGLNEVIVASPLLEDYIRNTYPNFKVTSSTCKRITDPEKLSEELAKDYHIVVLDYDLNNKFDILEKLDYKEKCELLVNSYCRPNCKFRSEHYRVIGARQIAYNKHLNADPRNTDKNFNFHNFPEFSEYFESPSINCDCASNTIFDIKKFPTHISPDAIFDTYMPMGFNQFKLEGRNVEMINLIEQYLYYFTKPETRDEARYLFYVQLANRGLIKFQY